MNLMLNFSFLNIFLHFRRPRFRQLIAVGDFNHPDVPVLSPHHTFSVIYAPILNYGDTKHTVAEVIAYPESTKLFPGKQTKIKIEWGSDIGHLGNIVEHGGFCVTGREDLFIRRRDGEQISSMRIRITIIDERGVKQVFIKDYVSFYTAPAHFHNRLVRKIRQLIGLPYDPEEKLIE